MTAEKTPPQNAVLFHHPDAVDTGREQLMGRHAAGQGFLKGYVRHSGVDAFYCQVADDAHGDDFIRRVGRLDDADRPCHVLPAGRLADIEGRPDTLWLPMPTLGPSAWQRRQADAKSTACAA